MELRQKQKAFCENYVSCGNATQAAIDAGYSTKTAKVIGAENLTKPYISDYIKKLQSKIEDSKIMSAKERQQTLTDIARNVEERSENRIKAIDTLNKMSGEYINKVEVSGITQEKNKLSSIIEQMRGDTDE